MRHFRLEHSSWDRYTPRFLRKLGEDICAFAQYPVETKAGLCFPVVEVVKGEFSMFAVIVDGNRQHRVQEGSFLSIDYRNEVEAGASITFDQVLLANGGGPSVVGTPTISGASVVAEVIIPQEKGIKLEIQKLRKRKNSRRHTGHRQKHTRVQIKSITVPGIQIVEPAAVGT